MKVVVGVSLCGETWDPVLRALVQEGNLLKAEEVFHTMRCVSQI